MGWLRRLSDNSQLQRASCSYSCLPLWTIVFIIYSYLRHGNIVSSTSSSTSIPWTTCCQCGMCGFCPRSGAGGMSQQHRCSRQLLCAIVSPLLKLTRTLNESSVAGYIGDIQYWRLRGCYFVWLYICARAMEWRLIVSTHLTREGNNRNNIYQRILYSCDQLVCGRLCLILRYTIYWVAACINWCRVPF